MEGKWTKGPWGVDAPGSHRTDAHTLTSVTVVVASPDVPFRGHVCFAQSCEHINGMTGEEVLANARLIAQAPAMAEALEQIAHGKGDSISGHLTASECRRIASALLTAIKGE